MEWNVEVQIWGLVIVYFIAISFMLSMGILFVRWNWTECFMFIPRLPIRSKWPPYLFVVLHILNVIFLFSIYAPLIKNDLAALPVTSTEKLERVVKGIQPRLDVLSAVSADSPNITVTLIDPAAFYEKLGEQVGFRTILEFNQSSMVLSIKSSKWWGNLAGDRCDTGVEYSQLTKLANYLPSLRDLPTKFMLFPPAEFLFALKENDADFVQEIKFKIFNKWDLISHFSDGFEQFFTNLRESLNKKLMYKRDLEDLKKDDRMKMIYIPSISIVLMAIFSIFVNLWYKNSPTRPIFNGFIVLGIYGLIFQNVFYTSYKFYLRHQKTTGFECDLETIGGMSSEYDYVHQHFKKCARENGTALRRQFWNGEVEYLEKYREHVVRQTSIFIPSIEVQVILNHMEVHKNTARKLENTLRKLNETLPDKCIDDDSSWSLGRFIEPTTNINRYLNVTTHFLKVLENRTLAKENANLVFVNQMSHLDIDAVKAHNKKLDNTMLEVDFDCQEVFNLIEESTSLTCDYFDQFYKDISDCALMVCTAICALLVIMSHRRTDLRQFAMDGRQKWIYMIDRGFPELAAEFHKKVAMYTPPKATFNHFDANECRNRYPKVLCMDKTRVVLIGWSTYIHASWVKIPKLTLNPLTHQALFGTEREYMVTQAPIPDTIWQFYAMCWQKNVSVIVMLCSLGEKGCTPYYPYKKGESQQYNNYLVTCFDIKEHPVKGCKWAVLRLEAVNEIYTDEKYIDHIFATWWPENQVPDDPHLLIDLVEWVNCQNDASNPPIVVQSSAGIGRAATYVAFDYLNARALEDHLFTIADFVIDLRKMRWGAIETEEQFIFLIVCIVEYCSMEGIIDHDYGLKYIEEYNNYKKEKKKEKALAQKAEAAIKKDKVA